MARAQGRRVDATVEEGTAKVRTERSREKPKWCGNQNTESQASRRPAGSAGRAADVEVRTVSVPGLKNCLRGRGTAQQAAGTRTGGVTWRVSGAESQQERA